MTASPLPTAAAGCATPRVRAGRIVADVAGRLADPRSVVAVETDPGNVDEVPGRPARSPWTRLGLGKGHPGVALLFAELAHSGPAHRATAHRHLSAAVSGVAAGARSGLFGGAAALAFAACAARRGPRDYAALLEHADTVVLSQWEAVFAAEDERLGAGLPGVRMHRYDLISGAAGLGRYLLLRRDRHHEALSDVLAYLVRLTEPVRVDGHTVPGWWVNGTLTDEPDGSHPRGHFNLGLAHGIPGVLALLALAREADVRVPGQDGAITRVAEWVLRWQGDGLQWPAAVAFEEHVALGGTPPAVGRTAWCYGTPGVARALYLAGRALRRADWQRTAVDALVAALADVRGVYECALCHGWAGLLQTTWRMARDSGDQRLADDLPRLAAPILDAYDPGLPFGYSCAAPHIRLAPHRAGFLEGAAGIALALHTYATDAEPATSWDAALLLC
ncbi:lanthionine synthetase C family protein [Streptomyces sp. NPDC053048]|uniref:lanthionine synthetase C family protein n=1 Tax=Streptomyces sp. NPDC053048 TaxID=3365694 RepID=UPI0037D284C9